MPTTVIVVLDEGDPHRGEITFAESIEHAQRILEEALQSGVDRARLRVFNATEHSLRVSYKPVVELEGFAGAERAPVEAPAGPAEDPDTPEDSETPEGGSVRFSSLFRRDTPVNEW